MGLFDSGYTDPIARFEKALGAVPVARAKSSVLARPVELEPEALATIIADPADQTLEDRLAQHIAFHSPHTLVAARHLIRERLSASGTTTDKAKAISEAASSSAGPTADVELSDPVMLWPGARLIVSILLWLTVVLSVIFLFVIAEGPGTATAGYIALAVVGAVSLLGAIVLVMGYKNVTIKGGLSAPKS